MKINVEVDISPEELRRFMGLPDVGGLQEQWLSRMSTEISSNTEKQQEFFGSLMAGAIAPWRDFFSGLQPGAESKDEDK